MIYEYECFKGHRSEVKRAMVDRNNPLRCDCGLMTERRLSVVNNTFGWRFTEASNERWAKEETERDI